MILQQTMALFLMFISHLQSLSLIQLDNLNYPQSWKETLGKVKNYVFFEVNWSLSSEQNLNLVLTLFMFKAFLFYWIATALIGTKKKPRLKDCCFDVVMFGVTVLIFAVLEVFEYEFSALPLAFSFFYVLQYFAYIVRYFYFTTVFEQIFSNKEKFCWDDYYGRIYGLAKSVLDVVFAPIISIWLTQTLVEESEKVRLLILVLGSSFIGLFLCFFYLDSREYCKKAPCNKNYDHLLNERFYTKTPTIFIINPEWSFVMLISPLEKILLLLNEKFLSGYIFKGVPVDALVSLGLLCFTFIFIYWSLPAQKVCIVDCYLRLSNLLILVVVTIYTVSNVVSEPQVEKVLLVAVGGTLFLWIWAFYKVVFNVYNWLNYVPPFCFFYTCYKFMWNNRPCCVNYVSDDVSLIVQV
eukprot:snap_masked-scaffold_13-processed-gene-4.43-mRNA-1 protein AED:1.00 eAED:1.00 QI:0/0/0/0/1/1/2/0/408